MKAAWKIDDALVFSAVAIDYEGQPYRIEAHARDVSIEDLENGRIQRFSTDDGAEHCELAREVFDGVEWDLTTVFELISLFEHAQR